MKANHLLAITAVVVIASGTAGCDPVHEPWVNSENDLRQERDRAEQQAEQLRHRMAYTQIDR